MIPKDRGAYGTNSFRQKISLRDYEMTVSVMMPRVDTDMRDMRVSAVNAAQQAASTYSA
jgi:hypothetical protein